ncbi:cysteine/glutathione ABC transporter permease/ATP-binding protein CydD [Enterovibrio sp. ZSDZ42]|uniref:Cysteine/glutathione ABC transporter permease/ATP-binding protein CydD n=1 Tax=Enterovibrio gelatinilyticus TaxID=2899819 RepID=A0ABT5R604_9GAMM|nr:cysteine/glutathione ABC transporter permease/ATP-binding protein CydD [Enterovibrio sp. ZSDZ42]MDD1794922.1 cysteine/glutathione ABC transporter permease/ATP-binding protein CydD [Enterovibrio sp. ZSDZ42]
MDKKKQRSLVQWLKGQSKLGKTWLVTAIGLAFLSGLFLIAQAALLANILHELIIEKADKSDIWLSFVGLAIIVCLRAICSWGKEQAGYRAGEAVRLHIRHLVLDKLQTLGPATIQGKPAGTWASLVLEQVEEMQDFFARYLPQMAIAGLIPLVILVVVFPLNWAAGLIFLLTAPLVPFFMALVGMGAADANRRNFKALQRLSGHFYDRLRGLATIRLFDQADAESQHLKVASEDFRKRTMEVLRLAFLSSAVLEFFTSLSIAITAVYFGFSYIGELNFGHYGLGISLFIGVFVLVLAPEFYQPLRDLGTYYHAKAQAIGAAESIVNFLDAQPEHQASGEAKIASDTVEITATDLEVLSPDGIILAGPLTFKIKSGERVALVGQSGAGKTSLINAVLGFLPYRGSLVINGIELKEADLSHWRKQVSWVGQNPQLFHGSVKDNICLSAPLATEEQIQRVAHAAHANEFIQRLDQGYSHPVGDRSSGLSVGQAQRIAVARALLQDGRFWLLDEPTASLDASSERLVMESLDKATKDTTTLLVSHRIDQLGTSDNILVMSKGKLVQQGTFDALKHEGLFSEMIQAVDRSDLDA